MAYIDDLNIGQLDPSDNIPLSYCNPGGFYIGSHFEGTDYLTGVYSKTNTVVPKFILPNLVDTTQILIHANDFIIGNFNTYLVPTEIQNETYIGISHKMSSLEISNKMIAFNDYSKLDLDHPDVRKIIRNNHAYLQGATIIKNGRVDYELAVKSIAVYDQINNFYVYSLVNGAKPEFIDRLYKLDLTRAFSVVVDRVKVPLNTNQTVALISLAFDIGMKKFTTSKLIKALNSENYNCATYFMEFTEIPIKRGNGISTLLYNRRVAEANLFSRI